MITWCTPFGAEEDMWDSALLKYIHFVRVLLACDNVMHISTACAIDLYVHHQSP